MSKKALKRRALPTVRTFEQGTSAPTPAIQAAVMISLSERNDAFVVTLPGIPGLSRPHIVTIPYKPIEACKCRHHRVGGYGGMLIECNVADHMLTTENKSLTALHGLLMARKLAAASGERVNIGTPAAPTQALIEAFFAKGGRVTDESEKARQQFAEKYGEAGQELLNDLDLTL